MTSDINNSAYMGDALQHESPQSMIQSAEDFLILPMKKPCNQEDSGTPGVQIPFGVPLFWFLGAGCL